MKNKKKLWIIIIIIIVALLLIGGGTTAIIVSNSQVNDGGKKEWKIDDNQTFTYSGEEIAPKVSNLDENEKAKVVYSYSEKKDDNPIDDTYTTGLPKDAGTYYVKAALENDYKITTITIDPAEVKLEDIQVVYNQPFVSGNYFTSEMNIDQMEFEYVFTYNGTIVLGDVSLTSTFLSPSIKSYDYTFIPNDKNYKNYNGTIDIEVYAIVHLYDDEEEFDTLEVPFNSSFDYELTQKIGYDMPYFVDDNNNKFELGTKITEDLELHFIENATNYSITYNLDGGENGENPVSYTIESENIVFSKPTKKGYTFNGWYKEDTFTTKVEGIDKGSTGNVELFAKFSLNEYTITYNLDGGNNSEENPFFIHVTDHVVLQDAVKTGYNFLGWYLNDSKVEELDNISSNITLEARFEIATFTISFETFGGTNITPISLKYNQDIMLDTNVSKLGYEFRAWYKDSAFTTIFKDTKMPAENLTLYARYNLVNYNITYNLDGGDNPNPYTYNIESSITLQDSYKEGSTFIGWYSEATFENKIETIENRTGDIELFARFSTNAYAIEFNTNGGNTINTIHAEYNDIIMLPDGVKEGYEFEGWFKDSSFETPVAKEYTVLGNVVLFAKFEVITYTITYNLNGGANESNPASYTIETPTITLANATKNGYTFAGWYTESTFENKVEEITLGSTGNVELFAKFEAIEYTITYNLNGGTNESNPETYTIEDETIVFVDASKTGYTFQGWYSEATFENRVYQIEAGSTGNVELFAKYEVITYTITYNLNGGANGANPENYTIETPTITLVDASKMGYTFQGWYTEDAFENKVEEITLGSTGNIVLFAKYTPNTNTAYKVMHYVEELDGSYSLYQEENKTGTTDTLTSAVALTITHFTLKGSITQENIEADGSTVIEVKYDRNTYTITFTYRSGLDSQDQFDSVSKNVKYGYAIGQFPEELTVAKHSYQVFDNENNPIATTTVVSGNVTYYVDYTLRLLSIAYHNVVTPIAEVEAEAGDSVELASASKDGYTFQGWATEANGAKVYDGLEVISMPSESLDLYAIWDVIEYTITYNLNGGVNDSNPVTYTIETPTITLVDATKNGYTFNGWYSESTFENKVEEITLGSTGNVELFAKFTATSYTITYNLNGGVNGANPENYTIETPTITLAQATKTGYTFNGWYSDNEFNTQVTQITLGSTGNVELFAKFTATSYTITYNLNDGVNGDNPNSYTIEDATIVLANASKNGYTFQGWYTSSTFENRVYQIEAGSTGNVELFAKFTAVEYTITYNLNGGVNGANPATYTIETPTITLANATKTGYTFAGWYSDNGFNTQVTQITLGSTGNVELFAKYTAVEYTITYNLDGGVNGTNPTTYTIETSTITLAQATKTGYTFNGWYSDSGFNTQVTQIVKGSTGNKILYAKFSPIVYTITYNLDGGVNGENPTSYTILDTIPLADATKDGFTFEGWYLEATFQTKVTEISNSTGNITLFAYFIEEGAALYTITYVLNGGTLDPASITKFNSETPSFTLLNPTKGNAYSFAGWYLDSAFTERILAVDTDEVQEDITVYAKWSALDYTILYYDGDVRLTFFTHNTYTIEDSFNLETYNKYNHTFNGWYLEPTFQNQVTKINAGTTGTIKLYAKTTDKGFTVKFYNTDKTTLLDTKQTTTNGSVTAPSYTYDSAVYILKWVDSQGNEVDLARVDGNYEVHAQLIVISYTATIYYVDGDGYAKTKTTNAYITSKEVNGLSYGNAINLSRQMRVTDASAYDLFYMSPVSTFDWALVVNSIATGAVVTNADNTISCKTSIDGTTGAISIVVYCVQPVAIITSSSQTIAYSQNLDMSLTTYQFYRTVDEAFDAFEVSSGKLLRIYGRINGTVKSHCLTPHGNTTIGAASNYTVTEGLVVTRPKLIYYASDVTLHESHEISNGNIIMPYYRSCTDTTGYNIGSNTTAATGGYVQSVFVVDSGVTLTLHKTLNIGAEIAAGSAVYAHAVIMNNGTIIQENGSRINSYGFLKGTGELIVNSGATLVDYFKIYDWPGGANGMGMFNKNVFPFESYSFHNVSCLTKIYSGAIYKAWEQLYMASTWVNKEMILVGSGGLFQLSNGYIYKSIEDTTKVSNTNTSYTATNNDITVRDVLDIYGDFTDNTVSIQIKILGTQTVSTSTDMALPIGFMTIHMAEGNGTLSKNSYKFLPGSKLMVGEHGTLTISNGVKVVLYDEYPDDYTYKNGDTTQSGATNPYSYQKVHAAIYSNGSIIDGYHPELIVNGTLSVKGNLGGKINTASSTGTVSLSNTNGSLPIVKTLTYSSTGSSCTVTNPTVNAQVYLLSGDTFSYTNASATTYSAIAHNGEYGFTQNTNVHSFTLSYNINGDVTSTTIHTSEDTYTIHASDLPDVSIDGYVFDNWYLDSGFNDLALGYVMSGNKTIYAKLTPIIYNINYHIQILDDYDESTPLVNNNPTYFTKEDTVTFEAASCGDLNFNGWYIDSDYSISAPSMNDSSFSYYMMLKDESNTIHLYGYFSSIPYYSIVYRDQMGNIISSIESETIIGGNSITLADAMPSYQDSDAVDTSLYAYQMMNFSKWQIVSASLENLGQFNAGSSYTPTSSITIVPIYTAGDKYVTIAPGTISNGSYVAKVSGSQVGTSSAAFDVKVGTSVVYTITYTESESKKYTYTPASGNATSGSGTSVTITANYNATMSVSSEEGGGICVMPNTLITLADGTMVPISSLTGNEIVLTYNENTGMIEESEILALWHHKENRINVLTIQFDNGVLVEIVNEHMFYDVDLMKFVNITSENYNDYLGHRFYDIDGNIIVCTNIIHNQIVSDCYSIITKNNGNCYTNGILSKTPDPFDGYFETIYKLESDIEYRNEMIEKYGIFTYSQTNGLVTEEVYEKFYIKYFNIFLGLGLITEEDINGILLLGEDIIYLS